MVAVENLLIVEKARVRNFKGELANKVGIKKQLLSERQETSLTASCPLAERENFLLDV